MPPRRPSDTSPQVDWLPWSSDPLAAATGVSFDRTPAKDIRAPAGKIRVCAYHIDHDERPTCYVDVDTLEQAEQICAQLGDLRGTKNVDFAVAYGPAGERVAKGPW